MNMQHITGKSQLRREFLQLSGGCATLTNFSLLSTILNLSATNAVVADSGDLSGYKALVCVFLYGGNDAFNMLSPLTPGEREDYLTARGGVYQSGNGALGLDAATLHPISDPVTGRSFGIHPSMPEIQNLYNQGNLCFLANVGSLVEPTTMADYQAKSNLPLGLYSHSDLQRHWMTSVPQSRSHVTGWAGRMADCVTGTANGSENISMNISLNRVNMWQTGGHVVPYVVTAEGAAEVAWYSKSGIQEDIFTTLTDDALSRSYGNLVEKTFAKANRNALDAAIEFNAASNAVNLTTAFPGDSLSIQLKMVAKMIGARNHPAVAQTRQIFFVSEPGYDNHDELINTQATNLQRVNQAFKAFHDATVELGVSDDVLTFTASDFARTLNSNGKGSDHAWGGISLVMGDSVLGGRIYGQYPTSLAPGNELDLGRGRILPTTSVDEMVAELAMWYGVGNNADLEQILPNVRNFPSVDSGTRPLGMLS